MTHPIKTKNPTVKTHNMLLLNGPNLNLLGQREPEVYGHKTLGEIEQNLIQVAAQYDIQLDCFQSNHEGLLIDRIHTAKQQNCLCILLNPGAFTHTSIALRDAFLATSIPFIEIHLSNVYARDRFRQQSFFSDIAAGIIMGLGELSYPIALQAAVQLLMQTQEQLSFANT